MYFLLVVTLVPIALAIDYLLTRYRYTGKGKTILAAIWVVSYLAALGFIRFHFPDLEPAYLYLIGLALSLPIFTILALAVVAYLRHRMMAGYDQEIVRLTRERERLHTSQALIEQRLALSASRERAVEGRHREKLAEQKGLQLLLDEWQQAGGVARLRAVKVQEWRQELAGMDRLGLQDRRAALRSEIERLEGGGEGASAERQDQLRAQLKVVDLALLQPDLAEPNEELAELEKTMADLKRQKDDLDARLAGIDHELEEWRSRRNEVLAKQITLG